MTAGMVIYAKESAIGKTAPQCKRESATGKNGATKKQREHVLLCDVTRACNSMQNDK
jgi:hypothetical protein